MRWTVRAVAFLGVVVTGACVLGLLVPEGPPAVEQLPARQAERILARSPAPDLASLVRARLDSMRIPIRGKEVERLLVAVDDSARRFQLDPVALLGVIEVESRFDPAAVSPRGAMGLMQLRVDTARELAEILGVPWSSDSILLEPELNVLLGAFYLSRLVDRFGDLDHALAAFHSGPTRIGIWQDQGAVVPLEYADRVWDAILSFRVRALA